MQQDLLTGYSLQDAYYIVLDFETTTPKGYPPEPIELAAKRIIPNLVVDNSYCFDVLIKPPSHAPITFFDTNQTGIQPKDVEGKDTIDVVLSDFDKSLGDLPTIFVAQNAKYEAAIIQRFAKYCPKASKMWFLDTVKIAQNLLPNLRNHKLDTLAQHFSLKIPHNRHRAMPDVDLTISVFLNLLEMQLGKHTNTKITFWQLIAGIKPKENVKQSSLF